MKRIVRLTQHARVRSAQRALPEFMVDLLLRYGEARPQKGGSEILQFSHGTDRWLRQQLVHALAHWDSRRNTYAVLGRDGAVVTVGHAQE